MNSVFRDCNTEEIIFREGDPGDCAYLIERGRVQISVTKEGESFPVGVLGEGQIFGEMAIIDRMPRSATVTALEPVRLCVIAQASLMERIQNADPVVRLLMMMLVKRSRDLNARLNHQSEKVSDNPTVATSLNKEVQDAVRFESEIQSGFDRREFFMNYQPIVDLKNSAVVGYEALVRWNSPTLGPVSPGQFMSVIENSSNILPVGRWIIEQCMSEAAKLSYPVSINISPRQLLDPNFVKHLEDTRANHGLTHAQIKLEITEQVFVQAAMSFAVIDQCRALGYKILLDDFGTGYSSIAYLSQMNLDVLKIDQSFVRAMGSDPRARNIVQGMVSLAASLDLECVAEGIETKEIAEMLKQMGCALGQGYFFGRPQVVDHYATKKAV